jgi:hypothetical protein
MQPDKEYGLLCLYDDHGMLYLAPHGLNQYKLIDEAKGAAIFEKNVASEMIDDNKELFYLPLNANNVNPNFKLTTITNLDQWRDINK